MFAWAGSILHVDLANERIWKEPLSAKLASKFLGSRGVNAKLLWDQVKPGTDPLSPENLLIFGTGPLTGTTAPCSGRATVTCIGAETNLYNKTSMGGHWGAELKFAGYDHLIVYGRARNPVYLSIKDESAEIRSAGHLWGLDVRTTDETIKSELGDRDTKISCVGPAGENLVRFAAVMNSIYHAAARGGAGAVMGSKKLKAIAVRGTNPIQVKDSEKFNELVTGSRKQLSVSANTMRLYNYGTVGSLEYWSYTYDLPTKNFMEDHIEGAHLISGKYLVEAGYLKRRDGCFSCPISCHRYSTVDSGQYGGSFSGGPEYESGCSLGSGVGITRTDVLLKANELCNIMGLDTISTGNAVQWAMESYERGVLTQGDTDGLKLIFGNGDALLTAIPLIAHREGKIGDLLAEGVKRAAEKIGKDSWKWAMCNSKGLGQAGTDTRWTKGYALSFAVNPRGPDHLHSQVIGEYGGSPEAVELIEKITGDAKWASPKYTEYRPEIVRFYEDCYAATDALGFCTFTGNAIHTNPEFMAAIFSAATGIRIDGNDIKHIGRRILTLEKCFNVREGADRRLDDLPWRMMYEPGSQRHEYARNSPEELETMLDRYYSLHGWDTRTSWPRKEALEMLGLSDIAEELRRINRLPE